MDLRRKRSTTALQNWKIPQKTIVAVGQSSELTEAAFLMVGAASSYEFGIDYDKSATNRELDKVRELVSKDLGDTKLQFQYLPIQCCGTLIIGIRRFMSEWANRTKTAYIVLSGHCDSDGRLGLEADTPLSISAILNEIYNQWRKWRERFELRRGPRARFFPEKVKVVIGTCYSHVYKLPDEQAKVIEVIPVTTAEQPQNKTKWICREGEVVEVFNISLYDAAEEVNRTLEGSELSYTD